MVGSAPEKARLSQTALEVFDADGRSLGSEPIGVAENPGRTVLHRLAKRQVVGRKGAVGVLATGRAVNALYVGKDLLPSAVVCISGNPIERGTWFTSHVKIPSAMRGLFGPDGFARQVDFQQPWLARLFMRFAPEADSRAHRIGPVHVHEVQFGETRFFYASGPKGWSLYGAGSLGPEQVDRALSQGVDKAEDLFWALGAIRLSGG